MYRRILGTAMVLVLAAAPAWAQRATGTARTRGSEQGSASDQTVPVKRGARLEVHLFGGDVTVKAWAQDAVKVHGSLGSHDRLAIDATDAVVRVGVRTEMGIPRSSDLDLMVPAWMSVNVNGTYVNATIEGTQGEVVAETVKGDIDVRGGGGFVSLKSVDGQVTLTGAKARVEINSVNEGVTVRDVAGEIGATTVNGPIRLERIDSANVEASTVNGEVDYDGTIRDNGRYQFSTHNGDVTVAIPEKANATIGVRTFNGEFSSAFTVATSGTTPTSRSRGNRRQTFTLGTGSARLDLETFGGDIRLVRPGGLPKPEKRDE